MSIDATRHAWQRQGLRPAEKLVLLAMADRAGEDHCCWPSVDRLVLDTGLDRKTVGTVMASLQEAGEIEDTIRRKGKSRRVKVWRIVGVAGREDGKSAQKGDAPKNGIIPETGSSQNGDHPKSGIIPETGSSQKRDDPKNGSGDDPKNGRISVRNKSFLSTHEPTKEPTTLCASGDAPPSPGEESPDDEEAKFLLTKRRRKLEGLRLTWFLAFWEAFDHKRGKAAAADAWMDIPKLTNALCQRIVLAAKREAEARPALIAAGQTPKWAQGWITERRWEDEHGPAVPPRPGQGGTAGAARQGDAYTSLVDRVRQRQQAGQPPTGQENQESGRPGDRQGGAA